MIQENSVPDLYIENFVTDSLDASFSAAFLIKSLDIASISSTACLYCEVPNAQLVHGVKVGEEGRDWDARRGSLGGQGCIERTC